MRAIARWDGVNGGVEIVFIQFKKTARKTFWIFATSDGAFEQSKSDTRSDERFFLFRSWLECAPVLICSLFSLFA